MDELLIIVHPVGALSAHDSQCCWTEVPALPVCTELGGSIEEAVMRTEAAIVAWGNACLRELDACQLRIRVELAV